MSDELPSPHVGEIVHFVGAQQQPNGQVVPLCLAALVVMVLPSGSVNGGDGLPVQDPVILEIHRPDGIDYGKPVGRGLGKQPGTWHPKCAPSRIVPANGQPLGRLLNQG